MNKLQLYIWYTECDKRPMQWSGAVGVIQRNEADYAVFAFASTYERSKVATFSSVTHYYPLHWLTKYPQKLSPTWNLMGLFTKGL